MHSQEGIRTMMNEEPHCAGCEELQKKVEQLEDQNYELLSLQAAHNSREASFRHKIEFLNWMNRKTQEYYEEGYGKETESS